MSLHFKYDWLPDHSSSHMNLRGGHSRFLGILVELQVAYDRGRRLEDAPGSDSAEKMYHFVFPQHPLRGYEDNETLKNWSICSKVHLENMHRNIADHLLCESLSHRSVLSLRPSVQDSALTMSFGVASHSYQRIFSMPGTEGGYGGMRRSRRNLL